MRLNEQIKELITPSVIDSFRTETARKIVNDHLTKSSMIPVDNIHLIIYTFTFTNKQRKQCIPFCNECMEQLSKQKNMDYEIGIAEGFTKVNISMEYHTNNKENAVKMDEQIESFFIKSMERYRLLC